MASHVRALAGRASNLRIATFYSEPRDTDVLGTSHESEGFVSVDWLTRHTPLSEADVLLCGPRLFLHFYIREVVKAGVPATRIQYELFGLANELDAA